jgi:lipoate-protein ligase A
VRVLSLRVLDLTLPSPAENLACDEALLDGAEAGETFGVLRFWESPRPFVVLGYANKVAEEVNLAACREREVPILRRCSGGGCVVQGPGCLNYSVTLPMDADPALETISGANCFVMERNRGALAELLARPVALEGHTDLALGSLKFSGNAQRRKRRCLLFHGTFLLADFDITLLEQLLRAPPRQPAYRQRRRHSEFLTGLPLTGVAVKAALQQAWRAASEPVEVPRASIAQLVAERYSMDAWNLKW